MHTYSSDFKPRNARLSINVCILSAHYVIFVYIFIEKKSFFG